jgi:hypothetical protein
VEVSLCPRKLSPGRAEVADPPENVRALGAEITAVDLNQ